MKVHSANTTGAQNHMSKSVSYTHLDVYKRQEYGGVYPTFSDSPICTSLDSVG